MKIKKIIDSNESKTAAGVDRQYMQTPVQEEVIAQQRPQQRRRLDIGESSNTHSRVLDKPVSVQHEK